MDMATSLLHYFLDCQSSLPYDVRVISIADIQFHRHTVALKQVSFLEDPDNYLNTHTFAMLMSKF
jgi:hypothetical protein